MILLALITYLAAQIWRGYLHLIYGLGPLFGFDYPHYKLIEEMTGFYTEAAAEAWQLLVKFWQEWNENLPN